MIIVVDVLDVVVYENVLVEIGWMFSYILIIYYYWDYV